MRLLRPLTDLTALILSDTQVTDVGLKGLRGLVSLKQLQLQNTRITEDGVKRLKEFLPNVTAVR